MKISTKGRYALRTIIDIAYHREEGYISLKEIATRQDISQKYLEQIIQILKKDRILRVERGSHGGYQLERSPEKITVAQILQLTEGSLAPVECTEDAEFCERSEECVTREIWAGLAHVIQEYLDGITVQDILGRMSSGYDYVI